MTDGGTEGAMEKPAGLKRCRIGGRRRVCAFSGVICGRASGDFRFRGHNGHQIRGARLPLLTQNGRSRHCSGYPTRAGSGLSLRLKFVDHRGRISDILCSCEHCENLSRKLTCVSHQTAFPFCAAAVLYERSTDLAGRGSSFAAAGTGCGFDLELPVA